MEPTYRMEPRVHFKHDRVEKLLDTILESQMRHVEKRRNKPTAKPVDDDDELALSICDEVRIYTVGPKM